MAIRIELNKDILKAALDQAIALRTRNIKAATNELIKKALDDEHKDLIKARDTMSELK